MTKNGDWTWGWFLLVAMMLVGMGYLEHEGRLPRQYSEHDLRRIISEELHRDGGR